MTYRSRRHGGRPVPPGFIRVLAAGVAALALGFVLVLAVHRIGAPSAPPAHFGSCPAGMRWETGIAGLPECVR